MRQGTFYNENDMFQIQIICLSLPQDCAPTRVVSLSSLVLPSVAANPCKNTITIPTVHVYTTPVCAFVFFRPPESESYELPHLPLQEIRLCISLWPAGVWWYVFLCLCSCRSLVSGCMRVLPMWWECTRYHVFINVFSSEALLLPAMCRANEKDYSSNPNQINETSAPSPPLTLSAEHRVQAEEGGQAVLDCFLPWHRLLLGKPEYHYSWAPGEPGTEKVSAHTVISSNYNQKRNISLNLLRLNHLKGTTC